MKDDKIILTQSGLDELKKELDHRLTNVREKIANDIAKAREQGDLSENAAYTSALESKQFNETRISELENTIANAVVKKANTTDLLAGVGEKVTLIREKDEREYEYTLVGENESDPAEGKISIKSPIGAAILGKKKGSKVKIDLPSGSEVYKIAKIN